MKMTKTKKAGILLAALLVVSCLLFLFGKFPVMMLNGQCHQLKTYDSDGNWNGNEIFYEEKIC